MSSLGNAPRRSKAWFCRCDSCRFSRKWGMWLQTTESARKHAERYPGHTVTVSVDTPKGLVFYTSEKTEVIGDQMTIDDIPPF